MQQIVESGIAVKMITGDNIYTAVETARRAGLTKPNQPITILLGSHQTNQTTLTGLQLSPNQPETTLQIPTASYHSDTQ